ncbi:mycofactocin system GMC family oxidoreductase MftG [Gordonia sinesedis]
MPFASLPRTADTVIVGAGSAGCVLAEKLSADTGRTVVVIERGERRWPEPASRDLRGMPIGATSRHASTHPATAPFQIVRGRGLGGSSVINGGYFLRWHRDDVAGWPDPWDPDTVDAAYAELDAPGGTMGVMPVDDAEIGDAAAAFESYWGRRLPTRDPAERWPIDGVNRVLTNRDGWLRSTAAEAYLRPAVGRANLRVVPEVEALELGWCGGTVTGVLTGAGAVSAGEVILCAGTLGTAAILLRSGLADPAAGLVAGEHRGRTVGYRRRRPAGPGVLLPSVVHHGDVEIRCYRDDFASYLPDISTPDGVPTEPLISATWMGAAPVRLTLDDELNAVRVTVDPFAMPAPVDAAVEQVADMLESADFTSIVEPGSVSVGDEPDISQHAWGTMPMGERTDWLGAVPGVRGLRIVDGSILPAGGHSGPHATIMMLAVVIGSVLAGTGGR